MNFVGFLCSHWKMTTDISHLQVGENEYHAVGKDNHKKQFWDVWVFLFLFLFSKVNEDGKDWRISVVYERQEKGTQGGAEGSTACQVECTEKLTPSDSLATTAAGAAWGTEREWEPNQADAHSEVGKH